MKSTRNERVFAADHSLQRRTFFTSRPRASVYFFQRNVSSDGTRIIVPPNPFTRFRPIRSSRGVTCHVAHKLRDDIVHSLADTDGDSSRVRFRCQIYDTHSGDYEEGGGSRHGARAKFARARAMKLRRRDRMHEGRGESGQDASSSPGQAT